MLERLTLKQSIQRIAGLDAQGRLLFALQCAERLRPCLRRLPEIDGKLHLTPFDEAIEYAYTVAWDGAVRDRSYITQLLRNCRQNSPDWDELQHIWCSQVSDAVSVVECCLGLLLEDNVEQARWAAEITINAVQFYVQSQGEAMSWAAIESHPLVQRELSKQIADLDRLSSASLAGSYSELREESKQYLIPVATT